MVYVEIDDMAPGRMDGWVGVEVLITTVVTLILVVRANNVEGCD